jgi:hypothetical protein
LGSLNSRDLLLPLLQNMKLVERVKQLAAAKGCTPGQLALAWVLAQGGDVVPVGLTCSLHCVRFRACNVHRAFCALLGQQLLRARHGMSALDGQRL